MRISDWSSDVCSSDLSTASTGRSAVARGAAAIRVLQPVHRCQARRPGAELACDLHDRSRSANEADRGRYPDRRRGRQRLRAPAAAHASLVAGRRAAAAQPIRSEEHTSELQSLMRISYAVFCLKKKKKTNTRNM